MNGESKAEDGMHQQNSNSPFVFSKHSQFIFVTAGIAKNHDSVAK